MDMTWVISLLIFMMVLLCSMGLYFVLGSRATLNAIKRRAEGHVGVAPSENESIGLSVKGKLHALVTGLGEANKPSSESEVSAIREELLTAGYRHAQAPILFMGAKLLSGILALAIVIVLPASLLGFPTATAQLVIYVGAASAGYFLPMLWLRQAIAPRKDKIYRRMS